MNSLLISYSIVNISSIICVLLGCKLLHPKQPLYITLCYLGFVVFFFGRFYEFSNIKDDLGYQIPLFTNFGELTDDGMRYYDMCSKKINGQKLTIS